MAETRTRTRKRTTTKKTAAKRAAKKTTPTASHKAAMAQGRAESAAIRKYLDALKAAKTPRGRRRTPESIDARLEKIDAQLAGEVDPIREVKLIQERLDLSAEKTVLTSAGPDPADFEDAFVAAVGPYSQRQGITGAAWRQLGVPALVLRRAEGVPR